MMKLVTVYYPDKVDKEEHGEKYHVFCEQITMELTKRHNTLKLC